MPASNPPALREVVETLEREIRNWEFNDFRPPTSGQIAVLLTLKQMKAIRSALLPQDRDAGTVVGVLDQSGVLHAVPPAVAAPSPAAGYERRISNDEIARRFAGKDVDGEALLLMICDISGLESALATAEAEREAMRRERDEAREMVVMARALDAALHAAQSRAAALERERDASVADAEKLLTEIVDDARATGYDITDPRMAVVMVPSLQAGLLYRVAQQIAARHAAERALSTATAEIASLKAQLAAAEREAKGMREAIVVALGETADIPLHSTDTGPRYRNVCNRIASIVRGPASPGASASESDVEGRDG